MHVCSPYYTYLPWIVTHPNTHTVGVYCGCIVRHNKYRGLYLDGMWTIERGGGDTHTSKMDICRSITMSPKSIWTVYMIHNIKVCHWGGVPDSGSPVIDKEIRNNMIDNDDQKVEEESNDDGASRDSQYLEVLSTPRKSLPESKPISLSLAVSSPIGSDNVCMDDVSGHGQMDMSDMSLPDIPSFIDTKGGKLLGLLSTPAYASVYMCIYTLYNNRIKNLVKKWTKFLLHCPALCDQKLDTEMGIINCTQNLVKKWTRFLLLRSAHMYHKQDTVMSSFVGTEWYPLRSHHCQEHDYRCSALHVGLKWDP